MTIEYLRSFRLVEYAVFDLTLAFVGIYLLAPWLSKLFLKIGVIIPRISWILLTLLIGVLTHIIVGTDTLMVRNFLDTQGNFGLKMFILTLTVLGLYRIRMKPGN